MPWIPLCSYSYYQSLDGYRDLLARTLDWRERLEWRLRFCADHGVDYMGWMEGTDVGEECPQARTETRSISDRESFTEVTTPVGKLTSISSYQAASYAFCPKKHEVETEEDLRVVSFIAENTRVTARWDRAVEYLDAVGDRGVGFSALTPPPLQEALLGRFEPETALMWAYEKNAQLLRYEQLLHKLNLRICEIKAAGPLQVFLNYGVVGLALVSPAMIRERYLPFISEYGAMLRSAGRVMICHTSGEPIGAILHDIAQAGIGGLCGLSYPAPRNTPEIWEIEKALPPETVLCGGPTPEFLYRAGRAQVRDLVRSLLERMAGCGRFLLGTADDVVPGTPMENLEAVAEVVGEFR